jgi:hypothetical protein
MAPQRPRSTTFARLLLLAAATGSVSRADMTLHLATASPPEAEEAKQIVATLPRLPMRAPATDWERTLLEAGQTSSRQVLKNPLGPLLGMTTTTTARGDVLASTYEAGDGAKFGIRGYSLWDEADRTWFIMSVDPKSLSSVASADALIRSTAMWGYGYKVFINVLYAAAPSQTALWGEGDLLYRYRGAAYDIVGLRVGGDAYLLLSVGKLTFKPMYPDDGIYVPERFPRLRDLVPSWTKQRLLSEVGRFWDSGTAMAKNNQRDRILIAEIVKRGVSDEDLTRLLLPANVPNLLMWEFNTEAVMASLVRTNQVAPHRRVLEQIAIDLCRRQDAGPLPTSSIFWWLKEKPALDFAGLALTCLETAIYPEPPLQYLQDRGRTEDAYQRVAQTQVPERWVPMRDSVLRQIRERIDKGASKK